MKISVIIPVYNAETTLLNSLESICSQTVPCDVEIVLVDDCSTDSSLKVMVNFAASAHPCEVSVKICRHTENKGVAAARNTGLDSVDGDYVCYVDADDRMAEGALTQMVRIAEESDADIVGWDWTLVGDSFSRYMKQRDCNSPEDALKALMSGVLRWNLWMFMAKRNLYDGLRFIPGKDVGEDMMMMIGLLSRARTFVRIPASLYEYRQCDSSISKNQTEHTLSQVSANINEAERILTDRGYQGLVNPYIDFLKLNAKLPLLVSLNKDDYIRWTEWFPEADGFIMMNRALPLRTRMLQDFASKRQWTMVRMYNVMVYGILYRIFFR